MDLSLKNFIQQVEAVKKQINEVTLDQSQVAVPSIGSTASSSATSRPAGANTQASMKVIDFKDPNDPLKRALDQAVKNKEVTALGEEGVAEEELDEISKQSLAKYIKAAQQDVVDRSSAASFQSGKQGDWYNKADDTPKELKRLAGIDAALARLTKEEQVTEVAPPGMEDWIKGRKEAFKKQYGDRWEGVLYATAWDEYNKKHGKKDESMYENVQSDKQPIMESMLEEILEAYPHEHKMCQEGWAMDEGLYEALCDHYYKEGRIPRKIWHGPLEELRKYVEECYMEDTGYVSEEKKEYDLPPSMRQPATLDTVGASRTVDLVPQQQANRELNKQLELEPSMRKTPFETTQRPMTFESDSKERPYVCVHAKKGKHECKASSSYEAAKKAAAHWGMKNTAGIDAHLADVKHTAVNESDDMGPVTKKEKTVTVTHKTSGKELVIKDTPANRAKYKEMGYDVKSLKENHIYKPVKKMGNVEIHQGFIDGHPADYVVKVGGETVAQGMYHFPSNAFWFKIPGVKGDKAFDELDDVVNFFNKSDRLDEKWAGDAKIEKTGEYANKTIDELESILSKLKKSGPHKEGSPEYKKQNQIEFAIRSKHKGKKFGKVEESWQSQLDSLLNEGLTVTTSTGGPMGAEDSVSVSASGEDAKSMMELLRNAGIGHGGAGEMHSDEPEVTGQDEVLGQLGGHKHDDSGDTDLSFLKKMIGTPVEADGCDEGQTQTASPGDAHMSPMANKMDEADVEEGNLFTKGLEDDDVKIGDKIPGTNAIKTKDIDESDDEDSHKETEKSSTGGRIERKDGVTRHHAGKHYGGSDQSDDEDIKEDSRNKSISENLRLVKTYLGAKTDNNHGNLQRNAKVYFDSNWSEYRVKFYTDGQYEGEESDYHTDDREDANSTAYGWTIGRHSQMESYDSQDPTDVAGIDDEHSDAMRDAGLAASYVPEEALDQPATFEGKSCMHEDDMEESALQAYLGKKKYGEEGMKALQQAGREGASDQHMDKLRDKFDKLDEESYTFESLYKKIAMLAEESTEEKDHKAEKAGKKVAKDIEYDEKHDYYFGKEKSSKQVRDTATGHKAEKTDKGTKYTKKHDEKLDEWANSPQNKLSDEEFQTEIDYMLQLLSGGLNGPKVDNTTLPKTQVRPVAESESIENWRRLAGLK